MALPSVTEVARYWSNRCLRCDAPGYTCMTCWENTAPGDDGYRHPDCPYACRDFDHARYRTFCSGEPECIACGQFLGVIPEVWDAWTEDGHDLSEDWWPYGPGDIRFKGRLLPFACGANVGLEQGSDPPCGVCSSARPSTRSRDGWGSLPPLNT